MIILEELMLPVVSGVVIGLALYGILGRIAGNSHYGRIRFINLTTRLLTLVGFIIVVAFILIPLDKYGISLNQIALFFSSVFVILIIIRNNLLQSYRQQIIEIEQQDRLFTAMFEHADKLRNNRTQE